MFNFDVINIILILVVFINAVLGFFIFFRNRKNLVNIWFAVFVFSLVCWTISMFFYRGADAAESAIFWVKALYASALFIPVFFIIFSLYFLKGKSLKNPLRLSIIFLPTFILFCLVFKSGAIIKGVEILSEQENVILWGSYYFSYNVYFILYFAVLFIILFRKYFLFDGIDRVQVKYILMGTFIPSVLANISNLLLPSFGIFEFNWAGQIFTLIMVVFVVYAVVKHHLLNIKIIATEIFSSLISLILLIDALLAKTWLEFLLKFGLFVGIAIFSVLLIRGVLNEVKARERIVAMAEILKKANRDLKKLDKAKSEFISIASHQLRTPLSVIKGYLSMILEGFYGKIPKKVRKRIEYSMESNERLIKLVDSLLDLSHMEGGRMEFNFKKISFSDLVESVYQEYKETIKKKGLKMSFKKPDKKRFYVEADEQKLRQVIANLVDNAIKYTKKGGIKIKLNKEDGNVVFSVKDSGIGIDPEEKKQLFKKFIRGKKVSRLWTGGVGLGLYVARLIVEEHKGEIGLESKGEGKGSKFWVKLPLIG